MLLRLNDDEIFNYEMMAFYFGLFCAFILTTRDHHHHPHQQQQRQQHRAPSIHIALLLSFGSRSPRVN